MNTLLTFAPSIVMEESVMFSDIALPPEGSWDRLQPLIGTLHQQVNQLRFPPVYKNIIGDMSCAATVSCLEASQKN